jgi:alkylresorcinol/alkylpyrone synthase
MILVIMKISFIFILIINPILVMPNIIETKTIDLDFKTSQEEVVDFASQYFKDSYITPDMIQSVFDNTGIKTRQFISTREWFDKKHDFLEKNSLYVKKALEVSTELIKKYQDLNYDKIDNIIFVSSTGLCTPSVDALLINELKLNNNITRTPVWGLGCVGGAVGLSKAFEYCLAFPDKITLLIALEFCSLAFLDKDHSKSNFIAMALFSDGAASALVCGDDNKHKGRIKILNTHSTLYYDSTNVMGWDFVESGLKAIFSKDIPNIVKNKVSVEIKKFLNDKNLQTSDIKHFLLHPGGTKIIEEFESSLSLNGDSTRHTKKVLQDYGNMSSPTVIYVINEFLTSGEYSKGDLGLISSLGPGFSSEVLLFQIQ